MLSDQELQALLRERGYVVPLIVLRTWTRSAFSVTRNRNKVEKWLLHDYGGPGRKPRMPQFIAAFDTNIRRFMEIRNKTPRLPR